MDSRPNIILFVTEQHRGDCLSIDGHPVLLTPNMDSIGGAGVRFTHCYTTCPTCIAARRSILSGQSPATHGMVGYRDAVEWDAPTTLPQALREQGYQTCWVGRSMHQFPARKRYGFDHMVIHGWDSDYVRWLNEHQPAGSGGYMGMGCMHNDWTARPWHMDESLHHTNWTVSEALRFLETRDPSCPFFLVVSFLAAHPPLTPPAFYMERYLRQELPEPVIGDWAEPPDDDGVGDDIAPDRVHLSGEALHACRAGYYALINHVDDQLRRILNPITGVDRMTGGNTVVALTSDHGEMLGDHYLWRKSVPYEGSARIPLMIRAPERFGLRKRLAAPQPVCLEDIMPTLLDMADCPIPSTVEGRSLLPILRGESPSWRPYLHIEHAPLHHTLTDAKQKYIWHVATGREQLFDLVSDPHELHEMSTDVGAASILSAWRQRLVRELAVRPEGFSDGHRLVPGRPYEAVLPHGGKAQANWSR